MESDVRSVAAQFIPSKASTCPFAICDSMTLLIAAFGDNTKGLIF
ncbi:unnamed protein product [Brassica oleracea var. botrytis]